MSYMKKFNLPNWNKSIVNISASLSEFLGAPNSNPTLQILNKELAKKYKNVVFICFDGLGINPLKKNLSPFRYLRKNVKGTLTSTFPSTTTSATTTLQTNKLPFQHGWYGWNLYFKDIGKVLDLFWKSDSVTGERVDFNYPMDAGLFYFEQANTSYNISLIAPKYFECNDSTNKITIKTSQDLVKKIEEVCKRPKNQFMYCYFDDPDYTMHDYGVKSKQAKAVIKDINAKIKNLCKKLNDTLIIISADHGQIDVKGYVEFYKDQELNSMLECIPYLDARTPAFKVKSGYHEKFESLFKQKYGKDFILYKTADLIKENYFGGSGTFDVLLGDFIAVGTYTNKILLSTENSNRFKGHHTSLTDEMLVPLIIIGKK